MQRPDLTQTQTTADFAPQTTDAYVLLEWGRRFVGVVNNLEPGESLELVDVEVSMAQPE